MEKGAPGLGTPAKTPVNEEILLSFEMTWQITWRCLSLHCYQHRRGKKRSHDDIQPHWSSDV